MAQQEGKIDKIEWMSPNDQMMERVMKVINENISNPDLGVEFIADKIGISRVHFHRRLKNATGLTPRDLCGISALCRLQSCFQGRIPM